MAIQAYVSIHGKVQGEFRGNDKRWQKNGIEVSAFSFGVKSPRDIATGQASGKRQHQPIIIVKEWGASSPQLFQALVSDEVLDSVMIEFVDQDTNRPKSVSFKIHLTNATISQMHHIGGGKYQVSFVYEEAQASGGTPPPGAHQLGIF